MHIRLNATHPTALMLAGVAVLVVVLLASRGRPVPAESPPTAGPLGTQGLLALERCRHNVTIIHDVHWAAACESNAREVQARLAQCHGEVASGGGGHPASCQAMEPPDDLPDCTLPPNRAFALNNARSLAENQCLDEAAFAQRIATVAPASR